MALINESVLTSLRDLSGADLLNQLIDVFLEETPKLLEAMHVSVASGDVDTFRRSAHSLKSNADTFGATELAVLARELELMGRHGDLNVGSRLDVVRTACDAVSEELRSRRS
jgi:HPt (histidine-containing phosphotransfer) domain-containing protein